MDLKIGLIGAQGRLGQEIAALYPPSACFTKEFPAYPDSNLDLYLDVSDKTALAHNLSTAIKAQKPIVIGTTGHENLASLIEASRHIPIFYTPNFSLGFALLKKLTLELARQFPAEAHIDLIETHHSQKKDAPSGTALLLAKTIEQNHPSPVKIHSIRSGQTIGQHTLFFNSAEEKITLSHEAHHRNAFAKGALAAALFLSQQPPGLYGMEELVR